MKTIGIISLAKYPVPSVKGGAVETLVTSLLDANESDTAYHFNMISFYDSQAEKASKGYKKSTFFFIKKTTVARVINKMVVSLNKLFCRKGSLYYWHLCHILRCHPVDIIILEASIHYAHLLKLDFPTIPIIQHLHNIPNEYIYKGNSIDNSSDGYLCISKYIAHTVIENLKADIAKVHVLYNSVDTSKFIPSMNMDERNLVRKSLGLLTTDFMVIFAGRLQPYKGIKELLQGFNMLNDRRIKLMIVGNSFFAGSGNTQFIKELKALSKDNADRIIFTGYVPYTEIHKYYQASDMAVLPSVWDEPFGLTCLEAISSGLPVVITNSGGMPEIIDSRCALVVERDNLLSANIAKHITALSQGVNVRGNMSRAARKRALLFDKKEYWIRFQTIIDNNYL